MNYPEALFMKHIDFPIITVTMAHPNEWAVAELCEVKKKKKSLIIFFA